MSKKLWELLKQKNEDKANLDQVAELQGLMEENVNNVSLSRYLSDRENIVQAMVIALKRDDPGVEFEKVRSQINQGNIAEIGWELFYYFSESSKEDIEKVRRSAREIMESRTNDAGETLEKNLTTPAEKPEKK